MPPGYLAFRAIPLLLHVVRSLLTSPTHTRGLTPLNPHPSSASGRAVDLAHTPPDTPPYREQEQKVNY